MKCPACDVQPFADGGPCGCELSDVLRAAVVRRVELALARDDLSFDKRDAVVAWLERTRARETARA